MKKSVSSKKKGIKQFWNRPIFSTGNVIGGTIVIVIAALIAWVPNPFKVKGATVDINAENVGFFTYLSDKPHLDKRLGLMAYSLTIVNRSDDLLTIKDLQLKCSIGGKIETVSPRYVHTKEYKGRLSCVQVTDENGKSVMHVAEWVNLMEVVREYKLLSKGETLRGSAFYLFPTTDLTAVREIYNTLSMVVVDYNGNSTEVPLTYPTKYDTIL
jgi:hypothetical protein